MTDFRCPKPSPIVQAVNHLSTKRKFDDRVDYGLQLLDPFNEWQDGTTGEGVKVAVLDSGVAKDHPDLGGAVQNTMDFTGDGIQDRAPHGTSVCGVIGSRINDKGTVGVAPQCELYVAKVLDDKGRGSMTWLAQGIEWAIDQGVDVINMSLGGKSGGSRVRQAVNKAYEEGITLVGASGNSGNEDPAKLDYPAAYPEVIAVGAMEKGKDIADYSNAGAEVVCPGSKRFMPKPPNVYWKASGTSFASPSVAGLVALYLDHERSQGNSPSPDEIRTVLHESAHDILKPGRDPMSGYGYISIPKLLEGSSE